MTGTHPINVAPVDASARRGFIEALGTKRVALRSRMHIDDIDDIDIVDVSDADVVATRKVLKLTAVADRTAEIDAGDVLESVDIVDASTAGAENVLSVIDTLDDLASAAGLDSVDDDAFFACAEPISTGAVTFELDDTQRALAFAPQRRLGWIVGMFLAAAVTLVVSAAITERVSGGGSSSASMPVDRAAPLVAPVPGPSTPRANAGPTIDVKSLPPALVGTIVVPAKRALYVDGKRAQGPAALVTCGRHIIKTGSSKPRSVDVPCGGQIALR